MPIATLPAGAIEYSNPQESEGIIRTSIFVQQKLRGVYPRAGGMNGQQYIGSASHTPKGVRGGLSSRLSDYFTNSYLKYQSTPPTPTPLWGQREGARGSVISAAILKHGLSKFSLQIMELGASPAPYPTPPLGAKGKGERDTISVNSDFILLEQYYLDRYIPTRSVRRIALGPAPVLNPNYNHNKGDTNTQFGKKGSEGAA